MNRSTDPNIEQRDATGGTYTKRVKTGGNVIRIDYSFASFFFNGYFFQREEKTNETHKNIYPVL